MNNSRMKLVFINQCLNNQIKMITQVLATDDVYLNNSTDIYRKCLI